MGRRVICDIETNGLQASRIWVIVCKDIDTGEVHVFRHGTGFTDYARDIDLWVGHYFLSFDAPVLRRLQPKCGFRAENCIDTLVVSRLLDFNIHGGHSLAAWGDRLGRQKVDIGDEEWTEFSEKIVHRCVEDVEINYLLYKHYEEYIHSPKWVEALRLEHDMIGLTNRMSENGFFFSLRKAKELREEINNQLLPLEEELRSAFPKKLRFLKEVTPKYTKYGTLGKSQFQFVEDGDLSEYNGGPFSRLLWQEFDPASPKQRIERLNQAGWSPFNKTKGHKEALKELRDYTRKRRTPPEDLLERLERFSVFGWVIDEDNLSTLPDTAPEAAQKLVQWLRLSNRISTLTTWIDACVPLSGPLEGIPAGTEADFGRIHGSFNTLGAWTQRMSHDRPNMGNVPKFNAKRPETTPYSDRMRELWSCTPGRYLVGVDAESIQLRIFGHYINDKEFIDALVSGRKEDGTDPHSLNQLALGEVCKSRDDAKTFIYAWLLGAGIPKVAAILGCSVDEASVAVSNFIERYPGLVYLREQVIPEDALRGYFEGFDGRFVRIKGGDVSSRSHFALGGYLQNGEAIIMKRANRLWVRECQRIRLPFWQVNFVHDEYQTETIRDWDTALELANIQANAIRVTGEELELNCPFAGSILGGHGKIAIGDNWMQTH